jgi:hypothetical protein
MLVSGGGATSRTELVAVAVWGAAEAAGVGAFSVVVACEGAARWETVLIAAVDFTVVWFFAMWHLFFLSGLGSRGA